MIHGIKLKITRQKERLKNEEKKSSKEINHKKIRNLKQSIKNHKSQIKEIKIKKNQKGGKNK